MQKRHRGAGPRQRFSFSFPHLISILSTTHPPLPASSLLTIRVSPHPGLHRRVCQFSSEKQGGEGEEGDKRRRREHEMEMGGDGSQNSNIKMVFYFNKGI